MLTVERAIRHGARGVLIVGCESDTACRYGADWTAERLAAAETDERLAAATASGHDGAGPRRTHLVARLGIIASMVAVLAVLTVGFSDLYYSPPAFESSQLVVSFKHPGAVVVDSSAVQDDEDVLPHMRGAAPVERYRVPVRLWISVDGREVVNRSIEPSGIFGDGSSIAVETITVDPGLHTVHIRIVDSPVADEWNHEDKRELQFEETRRRVVLFDRVSGFIWE